LCAYVAYPYGLGGVPRGRLCKSPLGVFFFEIENRFFFSQKKK